eukprot:2500387-Rhodomonas_salina.1
MYCSMLCQYWVLVTLYGGTGGTAVQYSASVPGLTSRYAASVPETRRQIHREMPCRQTPISGATRELSACLIRYLGEQRVVKHAPREEATHMPVPNRGVTPWKPTSHAHQPNRRKSQRTPSEALQKPSGRPGLHETEESARGKEIGPMIFGTWERLTWLGGKRKD